MKEAAVILGAFGALFLWTSVVAPAICRVLGVPMAFGIWRLDRKNSRLSRSQFLWCYGVFSFGMGIFLFNTVFDYLDWKLLSGYPLNNRSVRIVSDFVVSILCGLFFGYWRVNRDPKQRELKDKA
jgi:uncharacterized membrane protein